MEDQVSYDDVAPWPTEADGNGPSLTRILPASLGRLAGSWVAATPTPGLVEGGTIPGDVNGDGTVDVADIDQLCQAIRNNTPGFDLTGDGQVNGEDMAYLVEDLIGTTYGDANLDGIFNSRDMLIVFQAGEYEDGIPDNSTWREGDWNCDGDFGTGDLLTAFRHGGYEAASRPVASQSAAATLPNADIAAAMQPIASLPAPSRADERQPATPRPSEPRRVLLDEASVDRHWLTSDAGLRDDEEPAQDDTILELVALAHLTDAEELP
jgi:hypothetical protein